MCFVIDGYCEVYERSIHKAHKAHKCRACRRTIEIGEQYLSIFSVYEGETDTEKVCNQCAQDAVAIHRGELRAGCDDSSDESTWAPWMDVPHAIRYGGEDSVFYEFDGDDGNWGPKLFWPYGVAPAVHPIDLKTLPEYAK